MIGVKSIDFLSTGIIAIVIGNDCVKKGFSDDCEVWISV
jgi:hypothetical protein